MCNQKDCQHENQEIIVTDRDLMIGKAFMASMFMRIIKGTQSNHDAADWMVQAGACAIDCANEDCGTTRTMVDALKEAINHVDNGVELPVTALYNKAGMLVDGKTPTLADRLTQILKQAGIDLTQFPDTDGDEGVIDTIVVDPIPAFLDVSEQPTPVPAEMGRMVGADRGRTAPSILVGGPKRAPEQLH